jgi:hypothetical protein
VQRDKKKKKEKNECIKHPSLAKDKEKTARLVSRGYAKGLLHAWKTTSSEVL